MDSISPITSVDTTAIVPPETADGAAAPLANGDLVATGQQDFSALLTALDQLILTLPDTSLQHQLTGLRNELDTQLAGLKTKPDAASSLPGDGAATDAANAFNPPGGASVKFLQSTLQQLGALVMPGGESLSLQPMPDGMVVQGAQTLALQQAAMRYGASLLSTLQEMRRRKISDNSRKQFTQKRKVLSVSPDDFNTEIN